MRPLLIPLLICAAAARLAGQQVADTAFRPVVAPPGYPTGRGPLVLIDEGHRNFHTAGDRYRPFAELLRRDGFVVRGSASALQPGGLDGVRVLVIANAIGTPEPGDRETSGPAFAPDEVAGLRAWVERGGGLLLVADHMPYPAAIQSVGAAFGFELSDGFAALGKGGPDNIVFSTTAGTLGDHPIVRGTSPAERVDSIVTFAGQAFRGAGATPLLVLPAGALNLLPRHPWEFDEHTVRLPAGGWWQGAVKEVGRGRVAILGEAAMLTAQLAGPAREPVGFNHPAAGRNAQFALNLLRWLAGSARTGAESAAR